MNTKLSIIIYILNASVWLGIGLFCWSFIPDIKKANIKLDKITNELEKYDSLELNLNLDTNDLKLLSSSLRNKNVIISKPSAVQKRMREENGYKGIMFAHSGINASMSDWISFTTSINEKLFSGYSINSTVGLKNPISFILEDIEDRNTTINGMREQGTNTHIFFIEKKNHIPHAYTIGLYDINKRVLTLSNLAMAWIASQINWLPENEPTITKLPSEPNYTYLFNLNKFIDRQKLVILDESHTDKTLSITIADREFDAEVIMIPRFRDELKSREYNLALDSLETVKQQHIEKVIESLEYLKSIPVSETGNKILVYF